MAGCGGARDTVRAQNRIDLANDLLHRGDTTAAEAELKRALALDPKNEEAENVYGLVFLVKAQQAEQLLETTDCIRGKDAESIRAEADDNMRSAATHFARATELAPDYGEAWQNRGVAAMHFHDWDRAVEYLRTALERQERLVSAALTRANLGWAYFQKQDLSHATSELLQANQGARYFCLGKYRLASVYFARKEYDQAADALKPIFGDDKICPPLPEAQYLGGQTLLRLRERTAAEKAFASCVQMAPKSCQARDCKKALAELTP
jgi:tetratricopeptide (TPR) repeat protein